MVKSHPSDGEEIIMPQKGHYDKVTPAEYNWYTSRRVVFGTKLYDNAEELINGNTFDEMEVIEYRHEVLKDYDLLEVPFKRFRKNSTTAEQ